MKKSAAGNSQPGEYADAIMAEQENLLELPEQPPRPVGEAAVVGECKLRVVSRDQLMMAQVDVEHLIDEHHPARGIWEITGRLDLADTNQPFVRVGGKRDDRRGRRSC